MQCRLKGNPQLQQLTSWLQSIRQCCVNSDVTGICRGGHKLFMKQFNPFAGSSIPRQRMRLQRLKLWPATLVIRYAPQGAGEQAHSGVHKEAIKVGQKPLITQSAIGRTLKHTQHDGHASGVLISRFMTTCGPPGLHHRCRT